MLDLSDTGVPLGTTGLIQRQNLLDTGVPVDTAEQIKSGLNQRQELIRDRSTHRYYRTCTYLLIQEYP